jgi:2-polyprenyl-6-methoxyphenol hydroxylase-like FAD-dependent oxidoreductase
VSGYDALVLGAGPAGGALARRLSAAGARVALIGAASRSGIEGVSERSRALLLEEEIEPDALVGPFARRGAWGSRAIEGREWLVARDRLAEALRSRAVAAGARRFDAIANRIWRADSRWHVALRHGVTLEAPVLVEARGRRGPEERGPLLLALGVRYRIPPVTVAETRIETLDAGWCWWARFGQSLWLQIVGAPRSGHPHRWAAAAAARIPALAEALAGAALESESFVACPAHARLGIGTEAPGRWRCGDAAVALDPLSGQGIYNALSSARLIATAIRSVAQGGDETLAQRFVASRHAERFVRSVGIAWDFYRENRGRGEFWSRAAAGYGALHDALLPHVRETRIERRPVLLHDRIVEREVLVSPAHPRGAWSMSLGS